MMGMDVASSKKGVKKRRFWGYGTEIGQKGCLSEVKTLHLRCNRTNSFFAISDVIIWAIFRFSFMLKTLLQNNLVSWERSLCVLFYVKSNVKSINLLSAQSVSDSKSIAIWPAAAQLCHSPSIWNDRQPWFHEAHPQLSIDCESDQETRHDRDLNC